MKDRRAASPLDRREFVTLVAGGAAAMGLPAASLGQDTAPRRPNILFIECDSMDGRVMGCAGHPAAHTPNMDRLAARGVLFQNAYCNSPQCCPSRASMWSGRHTHQIQGWNNHKGIEPDHPTFRTHLDGAGYATQTYGKLDYLSGAHSLGARVYAWTRAARIRLPQKSGPKVTLIDEDIEKVHEKDWQRVDQCVEWLKQDAANESGPFWLYCGISKPHPSFKTSRRWLETIGPAKVTLPPVDLKLHPVMEHMSATKNCLREFSDEEILSIRRTYYAMVAEVDGMVGELMRAVAELGLTDSTYIIFTSDHGETNMEHRQYLKNAVYEGSARVPLIIAGPGVRDGAVVDGLVSLLDIYPTLMDMAGIAHPTDLEGHSLMPELTGQESDRPDSVLSQYHSNFTTTGIFMLRRGEWKYIAYPGYDPQLFNLQDDPDEMTDLSKARPDVAKEMDDNLREIVDYEAVDARAKQYDRDSFLQWRAELEPEKYAETMRQLYKDWSPEHDAMIAKWLGEA